MKKSDAALIKSRERVFKALSDGTRLEIIEFLKGGERCVCEIIPSIGKSQSTTSKNLDILFRAGILERRIDGKKTLYKIKHSELSQIIKAADALSLKNLKATSREIEVLEKAMDERVG